MEPVVPEADTDSGSTDDEINPLMEGLMRGALLGAVRAAKENVNAANTALLLTKAKNEDSTVETSERGEPMKPQPAEDTAEGLQDVDSMAEELAKKHGISYEEHHYVRPRSPECYKCNRPKRLLDEVRALIGVALRDEQSFATIKDINTRLSLANFDLTCENRKYQRLYEDLEEDVQLMSTTRLLLSKEVESLTATVSFHQGATQALRTTNAELSDQLLEANLKIREQAAIIAEYQAKEIPWE
jgi:hypothetical protein